MKTSSTKKALGHLTCLLASWFLLVANGDLNAREWEGTCGDKKYTITYTYDPHKDKIGNPWKSVLRVNGEKIRGFFIAGGDGYDFFTTDRKTKVSNRPSGHTLMLNEQTYTCR